MSENKSYDGSDQFNQKNESQKHSILWDKKKVQVRINKIHHSCKGSQRKKNSLLNQLSMFLLKRTRKTQQKWELTAEMLLAKKEEKS